MRFGDRREDVEYQLAGRRGGVDVLVQTDQLDAYRLKNRPQAPPSEG